MQIFRDFVTFSTDGAAYGLIKEYPLPAEDNSATALLEGIDIQFQRDDGGGADRHLGHLKAALWTEINGGHVTVYGTFGLRDYSGGGHEADDPDGDDPIKGEIRYSVFTYSV